MASVKSYKDLIVWQKSLLLAIQAYLLTSTFPKSELYGLVSQIRRAAVSIPVNIAEGQARNTAGEFGQFLGIAHGSLAELETLILLSEDFGYLDKEHSRSLAESEAEIGRMINGLQKALK